MRGREKQLGLKVVKADGSVEQYIHTKVLGAICNAMTAAEKADIAAAENLAEAITYYLHHRKNSETLTSCEILSIIKAVLSSTGYEDCAALLNEHHIHRRIKRSRIEVAPVDISQLADAEVLYGQNLPQKNAWNKSIIVNDLVDKHKFSRQSARAVAAMVEEKVLNIGLNMVPASLIKQLVLSDAAAILKAQRQLQTA